MFLKNENILSENNISYISDMDMIHVILESNEIIHNIITSMIKLEHIAIVNESEELLNEGVKETVKKLQDVLKKVIAKIKEWFNGIIRYFSEKETVVKLYVKQASKKLDNFDNSKHSFMHEVNITNEIFDGKHNENLDNCKRLINSYDDEFNKSEQIKKDYGVDSLNDIPFVVGTKEIKITKEYLKGCIAVINIQFSIINIINDNIKKFEVYVNKIVRELEDNRSKIYTFEDGQLEKNLKIAISKKSMLDYITEIYMLSIRFMKFEIESNLALLKKGISKIKE